MKIIRDVQNVDLSIICIKLKDQNLTNSMSVSIAKTNMDQDAKNAKITKDVLNAME